MVFTYKAYKNMLKQLSGKYQITNYDNWDKYEYSAILRHDIDLDIEKAVEMAELERSGGGKNYLFHFIDIKIL